MLEQPPFSLKTAFKQRHRWIFGVLQGMDMAQRLPEFASLPRRVRVGLVWGTRGRIASFAGGSIVGVCGLSILPLVTQRSVQTLIGNLPLPMPRLAVLWMAVVGIMWLGSILIGSYYNIQDAGLTTVGRYTEMARNLAIAPIAGVCESAAGLKAVVDWMRGGRDVNWQPTPKTKAADEAIDWSKA